MSDGSAKSCGFNACDIGQNRVDVIQRQFQRCNRRRTIFRERIRHIFDLGEGPMGFQLIEAGKPYIPILETTQGEERRSRTDSEAFVTFRGDVAAAAMSPGNLLPTQSVTVIDNVIDDLIVLNRQCEGLVAINRISCNRSLSCRICHPCDKPSNPLMFRRKNLDRPSAANTGKDRHSSIADCGICRFSGRDHLNPHLGLQRKSRQHVLHQAAFVNRIRNRQSEQPVVGACGRYYACDEKKRGCEYSNHHR